MDNPITNKTNNKSEIQRITAELLTMQEQLNDPNIQVDPSIKKSLQKDISDALITIFDDTMSDQAKLGSVVYTLALAKESIDMANEPDGHGAGSTPANTPALQKTTPNRPFNLTNNSRLSGRDYEKSPVSLASSFRVFEPRNKENSNSTHTSSFNIENIFTKKNNYPASPIRLFPSKQQTDDIEIPVQIIIDSLVFAIEQLSTSASTKKSIQTLLSFLKQEIVTPTEAIENLKNMRQELEETSASKTQFKS